MGQQKFYFQAVDNDSKRISGSIFAENEVQAKEKIKKQGLALFSIESFSSEKSKSETGMDTYSFQGTNTEGQHVRGKIEAVSDYEAYKKLRRDYEFEVTSIVSNNLDLEAKNKLIQSGISEDFKLRYKEDSFAFKKKKRKKRIEVIELSAKDKKELAFYSSQITELAREIRNMLEKSEKYIDRDKKREILKRIGLLERLKRSNAIDHLKTLTNKLIDQIADDKIFMEKTMLSEQEKEERSKLKSNMQNYSKKKKKGIATKALEMSVTMDIDFDAKQLVVDISRVRPLTQIAMIFYWSVVSLSALMIMLWLKNGMQLILNQGNITEAAYIFKSLLLWLITSVSLVNMIVFGPMVFNKRTYTNKERYIYFGVAFILNILIILGLPKLF
jgi:hypothetical protein